MSAAWLCWGGGLVSTNPGCFLASPGPRLPILRSEHVLVSPCPVAGGGLRCCWNFYSGFSIRPRSPPPSLPQKAPTCPKPVQADSCAPPTLDPEPGRLRAARLARQVWVSADCSCFFSTQHPAPSTNPGDPDPFSSTIQTIHPPIVPEQIPSHPPPPPGLFLPIF